MHHVAFAQDITPQSLVSLLSLNTNLLLALGQKQTILTSLASEFSLIPAPPGTPLLSHFPARSASPSVIPITPSAHPALTPDLSDTQVWFSGSAHALGSNPFLVPLLRAPPESFAADSTTDGGADALVEAADKGGEGLWAGSALSVLTGFQARGGARATWAGGVQMFSDEYIKMPPPGAPPHVKGGNEVLASDVAKWTFQESLVLRVENITHHRTGETEPREMYTTGDEIVRPFIHTALS